MKLSRILSAIFLLSAFALAQSSGTIFIVRHAERASQDRDSPLSSDGQARAECLAKVLADANVKAVFTTEFQRTQQTAAPLAQQQHITATKIQANDVNAAAQKAEQAAAEGNVLVVAHSNTIAQLISGLGVHQQVNIADADYDWLFVVRTGPQPQLMKLHYCPATQPRVRPVGMK